MCTQNSPDNGTFLFILLLLRVSLILEGIAKINKFKIAIWGRLQREGEDFDSLSSNLSALSVPSFLPTSPAVLPCSVKVLPSIGRDEQHKRQLQQMPALSFACKLLFIYPISASVQTPTLISVTRWDKILHSRI